MHDMGKLESGIYVSDGVGGSRRVVVVGSGGVVAEGNVDAGLYAFLTRNGWWERLADLVSSYEAGAATRETWGEPEESAPRHSRRAALEGPSGPTGALPLHGSRAD